MSAITEIWPADESVSLRRSSDRASPKSALAKARALAGTLESFMRTNE